MPKFDDSTIARNLAIAAEYFKAYYVVAYKKTKLSGGTTGFIPFNIEFTIDGLSGIKIYNKLRIDTSFLPNGYPLTLDFIVTGIEHKLKDGDWETVIKTTLIPKLEATEVVVTSANFKYIAYKDPVRIAPVVDITEETPSKNGERGDLFTWSQGFDWPDPHVSSNYAGQKVKKGGKEYILDETMRQKFLNFERGGTYVAQIFKGSKSSAINAKSNLIQKPGGRLTEDENTKFFETVLTGLGAPITEINLLFFKAWRRFEGNGGNYNAFNTTQPVGNSTSPNGNIQSYVSFDDGVKGTIMTMKNGKYPVILKALRKGLADYAEGLELALLVQQWSMSNIPNKWK
jgi:hypothetical protein